MTNEPEIISGFGNKPSILIGGTFRVILNGTEQYIRVDVTGYGETLDQARQEALDMFKKVLPQAIEEARSVIVRYSGVPSVSNPAVPSAGNTVAQSQNNSVPSRAPISKDITDPIEILKQLGIPREMSYNEKVKEIKRARAQDLITYQQYMILKNHFKLK